MGIVVTTVFAAACRECLRLIQAKKRGSGLDIRPEQVILK
jgi:hypothetical protein